MSAKDPARISKLIHMWLPNATPDEQQIAQRNLDDFIAVLYRICERRARVKAEARAHDKPDISGTVMDNGA